MPNRRQFLKGSIAAAVAGPVAATQARQLAEDTTWEREADVVIIGYGGAAACAAIEAHDAGASVLILEKLNVGGGNTAVSSGGFMIPKDEKEALTYLTATYTLSNSEKDDELLKTFCSEIMGVKAWISGLREGTELWVYGHAGFQNLPGWETIDKYRVRGKGAAGDCLFNLYRYAVEEVRKIPVLLETPAVQLIKKGDDVVGVVAENGGKKFNIKAKKAVILACGGYEYDPESLQTYAQGENIHAMGSPGNTGDGLRMAQSVGARLWHMTAYSCHLGVEMPGCVSTKQISPLATSFIWVNKAGKRFADEYSSDGHTRLYVVNRYDPIRHNYPNIPCFMIFDEKAFRKGQLTRVSSGYSNNREGYKWSKDNSQELANGVIKKADTLPELARIIGVPEDNLVAAVAKWNADITAGKDTEYERPLLNPHKKAVHVEHTNSGAAPVSEPLSETGPYYAATLWPSLLNTQGGPKRDARSRVMMPDNTPVPRLYAAGELGSIWGNVYQGACNNAESIVFGRIAGREAAGLEPWS